MRKKEVKIPTEEECFDAFCQEVKKALDGEKPVIAVAPNLRYDHRKKLRDIAEEKHRSACAVISVLKKSELEEQNAKSAHPMSQEELNSMYIALENETAKVRNEFTHVYTLDGDGTLRDEERSSYH